MKKRNNQSNTYREIIALKISKFIEDNNLSNVQFGKLFDVSESTIRGWRANKSTLDIDQLVKLCQYMGISLNQLVDPDYNSFRTSDLSPSEVEIIEFSRENKDYKEAIVSIKNMLKK